MSGAFRGDGWPEPGGPNRTSGTAALALVAGVLSFFCLFGFGGLLAVALGWLAHGEIERSEGRLSGRGLANTGIGLGIANLVACVVAVGVVVALALRPAAPTPLAGPPTSSPVVRTPIPSAPTAAPALPSAETAEAEPALPTLPPRVGKIAIIEASAGTLETQLLAALQDSAKAGDQVVLWTVTPDCEPCAAVGRALPDLRMQRALSKTRLVRVDATSFPVELQRLGVPIDTVPGFTLLDAHGHALDHVDGGEWDADIPANIAPILERFLRHGLATRRHPWSRPLREGETPL